MKKKMMGVIALVAVAAVAGYNVLTSQKDANVSELVLANVEALANPEQPNVDDCTPDPDYMCGALHPTDPSKDVTRAEARW